MGTEKPGTFTIDLEGQGGASSADEFAELVEQLAKKREAFLASLTPEARAAEEARFAESNLVEMLRAEQAERAYQAQLHEVERATENYHWKLLDDRKRGVLGTLTEVGRPFGLSGIAVGRLLDRHGLRDVCSVDVAGVPPEMQVGVWPPILGSRYVETDGGPLRLMRAVIQGYALHDPFDGRDYWVVEKVSPLLAPHAKTKKP